DESVKLPVFAARVHARGQRPYEVGVILAAAEIGCEKSMIDADDFGFESESEHFFREFGSRSLPKRQNRREIRLRAHFFFPIPMRLQIDIAEYHAVAMARAYDAQGIHELHFVGFPSRRWRD